MTEVKKYWERAKEFVKTSWAYLMLSVFAAFQVIMAIVEIFLHFFRIPHWH